MNKRYLCVDFGKKRTGIARSSEDNKYSIPLDSIVNYNGEVELFNKILLVINSYQIDYLVFGKPLKLDSSEGEAAHEMCSIAIRLRQFVQKPVILWDEKLTTKEANKILVELRASRANIKSKIDSSAAVIILNSYLLNQQQQKKIKAAVIGWPLTKSLSPLIHTTIANFNGHDIDFKKIAVRPIDFEHFITSAKTSSFDALSITTPYKNLALKASNIYAESAKNIQTANWLIFKNGQTTAHNTDADGFELALQHHFNTSAEGLNCLLLGAGGAAKACAYSLLSNAVKSLIILNRTVQKAEKLVKQLSAKDLGNTKMNFGSLEVDDFSLLQKVNLVINATTIGMQGDPATQERRPIDLSKLPKNIKVLDIIYNPLETELLKQAKLGGVECANGLSMLVFQGVKGYELMTETKQSANIVTEVLSNVESEARKWV